MKIEKVNENKIRIIFNNVDLKENNLDIHSFMSNSIESQSIFLNMLDQAEEEIGFITDNYKLSIDAIALTNGTFIITVTRIEKEILKSTRVRAHRKNNILNNNTLVYKFGCIDDFLTFLNFLSQSFITLENNFSNLLYEYNNNIFLFLFNLDVKNNSNIFNLLSEFAIPINDSEIILQRIKEYGNLLVKDSIHK